MGDTGELGQEPRSSVANACDRAHMSPHCLDNVFIDLLDLIGHTVRHRAIIPNDLPDLDEPAIIMNSKYDYNADTMLLLSMFGSFVFEWF
jgi:hypothetical protein